MERFVVLLYEIKASAVAIENGLTAIAMINVTSSSVSNSNSGIRFEKRTQHPMRLCFPSEFDPIAMRFLFGFNKWSNNKCLL